MTNDEAMKLARDLSAAIGPRDAEDMTDFELDVCVICDHLISGDHKREIENAAFERAAQELYECKWMNGPEAARIVRALIQPPAQKEENGE